MTSTVEEIPEIALTIAKAFAWTTSTMIQRQNQEFMHRLYQLDFNGFISYAESSIDIRINHKSGYSSRGTKCEPINEAKSKKIEHVFEDMNGRIRGIVDGGPPL